MKRAIFRETVQKGGNAISIEIRYCGSVLSFLEATSAFNSLRNRKLVKEWLENSTP